MCYWKAQEIPSFEDDVLLVGWGSPLLMNRAVAIGYYECCADASLGLSMGLKALTLLRLG